MPSILDDAIHSGKEEMPSIHSEEWDGTLLPLCVRASVTRLSDLQPLQLCESAQHDREENRSSFRCEPMPWFEPTGTLLQSLGLTMHLEEDVGELQVWFQPPPGRWQEEICRNDLLRYLECLAPWR